MARSHLVLLPAREHPLARSDPSPSLPEGIGTGAAEVELLIVVSSNIPLYDSIYGFQPLEGQALSEKIGSAPPAHRATLVAPAKRRGP